MTIQATLCEIILDKKLLLQKKSKGRFGEGKWNSPGGKLKEGEDPFDGVVREVWEETGLKVLSLFYHGILNHYFGQQKEPDWIVHVFSALKFEGEIKENEEGELKWFEFEDIPYVNMWKDDFYWLPSALQGLSFNGDFFFNKKGNKIISHTLRICE